MNKKIEKICIISEGYPTAENPIYSFVDQLACALADMSIHVSVIAPQSLTKAIFRKSKLNPQKWERQTKEKNIVHIFQPYFLTFSNFRFANRVQHFTFEQAILLAVKKHNISPDVFYGHFWHCGLVAAKLARIYNKKSFTASGESVITLFDMFPRTYISKYLPYVSGTICVSSSNQDENIRLGLTTLKESKVIVNAVELSSFYKYDKSQARQRLGLPKESFIVCFVGSFTERKGSKRLSSAIKQLNDNTVNSIFIGDGSERPENSGILFCGLLPHNQIVHYLNASDVFVLPTLAEGCSNSIVEAMACGLPIISSDLPFNKDILDRHNSIQIDPTSIDAIAKAICYLKCNPEIRKSYSSSSLSRIATFDIKQRTKTILDFMYSNLT